MSRSTLTGGSNEHVPVLGSTTITLQTKDANGNNETSGGLAVTMSNIGAAGSSLGSVIDNNDGIYTATFSTGTTVGISTVSAAIGGLALTSTQPTVTVTPGAS